MPLVEPLLSPDGLTRLRQALAGYTVDAVHELLGPIGQAAHDRGDLAGVARIVRAADEPRLAALMQLFLLGEPVTEAAAAAALAPLPLDEAAAAGVIVRSADEVRALLDVRPYAQSDPSGPQEPWWVVSDFGSDVRPGQLRPDHVLGVGSASLTLAQATPREPIGRALDIGTGSGVQALHLSRHSGEVTGTDVSHRALRYAATTAALSGQHWDLRAGSLFEPVGEETFDLVVANPPFVVSAGRGGFDYRDSGLPGDAVSERLVRGLGARLRQHGTAVLLANWIIPPDGDWRARVSGWLEASGCDAWVWQREVAGPGEYASLWLRDAGLQPATPAWRTAYDSWLSWFEDAGVAAIGMGLVVLWRTGRPRRITVLEDVPQPVEQPAGAHLHDWIRRQRWLADISNDELLRSRLRPGIDVVRTDDRLLGAEGWTLIASRLRQLSAMRWEVEVDESIAALLAGLAAGPELRVPVELLAAVQDVPTGELATAVLPVIRDLVGRGFLVPAGPAAPGGPA